MVAGAVIHTVTAPAARDLPLPPSAKPSSDCASDADKCATHVNTAGTAKPQKALHHARLPSSNPKTPDARTPQRLRGNTPPKCRHLIPYTGEPYLSASAMAMPHSSLASAIQGQGQGHALPSKGLFQPQHSSEHLRPPSNNTNRQFDIPPPTQNPIAIEFLEQARAAEQQERMSNGRKEQRLLAQSRGGVPAEGHERAGKRKKVNQQPSIPSKRQSIEPYAHVSSIDPDDEPPSLRIHYPSPVEDTNNENTSEPDLDPSEFCTWATGGDTFEGLRPGEFPCSAYGTPSLALVQREEGLLTRRDFSRKRYGSTTAALRIEPVSNSVQRYEQRKLSQHEDLMISAINVLTHRDPSPPSSIDSRPPSIAAQQLTLREVEAEQELQRMDAQAVELDLCRKGIRKADDLKKGIWDGFLAQQVAKNKKRENASKHADGYGRAPIDLTKEAQTNQGRSMSGAQM